MVHVDFTIFFISKEYFLYFFNFLLLQSEMFHSPRMSAASGGLFTQRPVKATVDTVKLRLFHDANGNDFNAFSVDSLKDLTQYSTFDSLKPTVFYFHGYDEKMTDEHILVITDAYQTRGDHNFIMVDWEEMADGNYLLDAIPNAIELGKVMGEKLANLADSGFPLNTIHLVGHSLGGQLVGYIGRTVQEKSNRKFKIKRITALDVALPGFHPEIFGTHLSKKDAEFVDIIHTDAWLYGSPASKGTADFWPNGGITLQPGCPKRNYRLLSDQDLCSHHRSWRFWAESIKSKGLQTFPAVKAANWKSFNYGKHIERDHVVSMGIDCALNATGDYYLQTNGETPYSYHNIEENRRHSWDALGSLFFGKWHFAPM